jgi:hypothetical protein
LNILIATHYTFTRKMLFTVHKYREMIILTMFLGVLFTAAMIKISRNEKGKILIHKYEGQNIVICDNTTCQVQPQFNQRYHEDLEKLKWDPIATKVYLSVHCLLDNGDISLLLTYIVVFSIIFPPLTWIFIFMNIVCITSMSVV